MLADMHIVYHVMSAPSPLGLLFLATSDKGVRHIEYMDRRSLKRTIAAHGPASPDVTWEMSLHGLRPLADQIGELLTGARRTFEWRLDLGEDPLQAAVSQALLAVPYGRTTTVAELARAIGRPRDFKSVADAVIRNPIALLVPCHRVLGADGKPGSYVGGSPRKKFMLELESRFSRMGGLDDNRVIGELVRRVPRAVTPARVARTSAVGHIGSARATLSKVGTGVRKSKPTATSKPVAKVAAAVARTPALRATARPTAAKVTAPSKKRSR